ncbi:MAG: sodium-dependent transporter [Candidatus Marinimicrobia bacterium]|jgi:NSS family neurotransmitter:Na+ symporter|nr:sodium-dependent transporter [Candidatus Neomarinimicrobiota bacterium]MBT3574845.1 sodium-dependent transporter [Candidatus Neomarinimicrobiota bacterium]MBT3679322.1 sodium-dependent transporter [Candidatus Neomarinimicrobiota bacterium]MBT3951549.1 sodium-dependent transporter [Candidatus Neomarinimicrobiota bacterium]MBT4252466.1 sodium-dependent transporter [Candidatus Neomarinimicrobiota bacterium]
MTQNRESWGSKFGFILAAAGSAVGLGNIWKFPYIAGENGGAAFIFVYLICIGIIGFPVLIAEVLIGRTTQRNPVGAFAALTPSKAWISVGFLGVLAGFMILSFYSVIGGWTIGYVIETLRGSLSNFQSPEEAGVLFGTLSGSATWTLGYHTIFFALTMFIVVRGVQGGIEKSSKIMMPILLSILVILMIRGITLPGADKGLAFLLVPDWAKINGQSILIALGHAFFTLSLGMGAMMTYGSYMSKKDSVITASAQIVFLDTIIAIMAGVAIFTAVFASGLNPAAGPGLIFQTLPAVFSGMTGGVYFSFLFFLLLAIAALTSAISLLEVVVAYFVDEKGWNRKGAVLIFGGSIFLLGIPSALSFNLMSDVTLFGKTFFDIVDFIASNILLPFGGLMIAIFVGWVWTRTSVMIAVKEGAEQLFETYPWFEGVWFVFLRFVAPVLITLVLLSSLGLV